MEADICMNGAATYLRNRERRSRAGWLVGCHMLNYVLVVKVYGCGGHV